MRIYKLNTNCENSKLLKIQKLAGQRCNVHTILVRRHLMCISYYFGNMPVMIIRRNERHYLSHLLKFGEYSLLHSLPKTDAI
jgi:hypothetical protein